jgi:hypothetical protein
MRADEPGTSGHQNHVPQATRPVVNRDQLEVIVSLHVSSLGLACCE